VSINWCVRHALHLHGTPKRSTIPSGFVSVTTQLLQSLVFIGIVQPGLRTVLIDESALWSIDSTHIGRTRIIANLPSNGRHVWRGDYDSLGFVVNIDSDKVLSVVLGVIILNLWFLLGDIDSDSFRLLIHEVDIAFG
jgi:hypothetical protein